jgi:hypothetical protein
MHYIKVHWIHQHSEEPVWLYSELDENRWEVRKVEIYRDGSKGFAGPDESFGSTWLGEAPVPPLDQINASEELEAVEIEPTEFERVWAQRHQPMPPPAEAGVRR